MTKNKVIKNKQLKNGLLEELSIKPKRLLREDGFTFKRFFVAHDQSPMKVTTDSVLLGAWSPIDSLPQSVLDIGTGCGVIGLMLAQRLAHTDSQIDAIDIDEKAIKQCQQNILQSPFRRITAIQADINHFRQEEGLTNCYDLIVSNPPYFAAAVECRDAQRQIARYTAQLNHLQLVDNVSRLLSDKGLFCLILPYHLSAEFIKMATFEQLVLAEQLNINYTPQKGYSLALLCFAKQKVISPKIESLCMRNADHSYTEAFTHLLKDFFLRF